MDHFAGLDVSVKETSICIVDETGRIVRENREPEPGPVRNHSARRQAIVKRRQRRTRRATD
jgi:hypothetical protein